jgi:hypothetical protein
MKSILAILMLALSVQAAEVRLAWDGVPEATSYKLYWGTSPHVYLYSQEGIKTVTYEIALKPGTWYIAVTAKNESGESGYSNEVITTVTISRCDLNNDGAVNVLDLQILARAIVRAETTASQDLNNDGTVNVLDLQRLSRVILGLEVCQQ